MISRTSAATSVSRGARRETYKGIGKYDLNLEGLPVSATHRSHGVHQRFERTMVTSETKKARSDYFFGGKEGLDRWTNEWRLFQRYADGQECTTELIE